MLPLLSPAEPGSLHSHSSLLGQGRSNFMAPPVPRSTENSGIKGVHLQCLTPWKCPSVKININGIFIVVTLQLGKSEVFFFVLVLNNFYKCNSW